MAIEGPLRELGVHDVFQLLDLSRKTGTLRVTSELRENEGTIYFDSGRVVSARLRSSPLTLGETLLVAGKITAADLERARAAVSERRLGDVLVEIGALTQRELEQQVRLQIEAVVFELMSWREGFFSFEERSVRDAPVEASIRISTESLLMEGARRIDEWSRIADKVPHLGVVPVLAPVDDSHPSLLDLLPNEWEVLAFIDGRKDLRGIAGALGRSEFEIAKIAYGLATTGIIELRASDRGSAPSAPLPDALAHLQHSRDALARGQLEEALSAARLAAAADPQGVEARLALASALSRLGRHAESAEELQRAAATNGPRPDVQRELGYAAARAGNLQLALTSWNAFLQSAGSDPEAERVREAVDSARRLQVLIDSNGHV